MPGPGEDNPSEWPNTNAFFANEIDCHIGFHSPVFAIWTMRDAFEEPPEDEKNHCCSSIRPLGGQGLFKHVICPDDVPSNGMRSWLLGPLYEGGERFTLDRWRFWRKGFETAAANGEFKDECRNVAENASSLMGAFEKSMLF
ncbi:hypothetical protein PHISCL_00656 [Aspergillus sclerotialis]|uniref:Uncharacterized protein n=1 Tax=Aspergillus sclerotialis TaxID=2070753 RepID=A0A3A3AAE2_9EURO|nr:hypothetical protein PHISCL_00656 [Aspergillus sclerotialis]